MVDPGIFEPVWGSLAIGSTVSVVLKDVVWDGNAAMGVTVPGGHNLRISGDLNPDAVGFPKITVLGAKFVRLGGLIDLTLSDASSLLPHRPLLQEDVMNYVEVCAGMGVSSFGFSKVGFRHRCAVEWQESLVDLHRRIHPKVPVIHADVCSESTARLIREACPEPFTLMAGISCQPYSRGGLGQGGDDDRSNTLPGTLRLLHLLQAPVLVLECVTQAQTNSYVVEHVKLLESQLGYHVSQCRMRLENIWSACRYRWWLIACHPSLGAVSIPAQPTGSTLSVRDLMPYVLRWSAEVENQLQLSPLELAKFQQHGRHLRQFSVQPGAKLPTALHSWGGQVVPCACGCRECGFSDALLDTKGLYAQLVQFTQADGTHVYRHLHAIEVAMLCGIPPCLNWGDNERLNLCAVGQMAAPMQSIWIASAIIRHLQQLFTTDQLIDQAEALNELKREVFAQSKTFFTEVPKPLPEPSVQSPSVLEVVFPGQGSVFVTCGPAKTVKDLIWAECDLRHVPVFELQACIPGCTENLPMDFPLHKLDKICLFDAEHPLVDLPSAAGSVDCPFAPEDLAVDAALTQVDDDESHAPHRSVTIAHEDVGLGLVHPPVVDGTVGALLQLQPSQLTELLPPLVGDPLLLSAIRSQVIDNDVRKSLLSLQQHVWGDDEVLWHMYRLLELAQCHDTLVLDPLLASSWLKVGNVDWVRKWLPADGLGNRIVSAVILDGHWTPFVWVKKVSSLEVLCWDHDEVDMHRFYPLHGLLCQALELPMFRVACTRRNFGRDNCGAAAIAFFHVTLAHGNMPSDDSALTEYHHGLKSMFMQHFVASEMVPKPWCWGAGVNDVQTVLANLLQFHGVPQSVSSQRAKLVLQSLGKESVQSVITGVSPWKSLKHLANQHSPVVQLVMPDELAAVTQARQQKDAKTSKKSGPRAAPARPAEVDPSRLCLTEDSFCLPDGAPVRQIPFNQVGPLSTGIALAHFSEVQPFLQAGKILTSKGLAVLAVNGPSDLQTELAWSSVRFAATCAANNQPVLLTGLLLQLGQTPVGPCRTFSGPAVPSYPVACARITVFKDQWQSDWQTFGEHPVKSILEALPPLQVCRLDSCGCDKWHLKGGDAGDSPSEVVLDVFRRQFFTDAGRPVKASQGTHFSVQLRYLKSQEHSLLKLSGVNGIFIEPRSMDASSPSDEYQVVWLPQASCPDVMHQAQCEPLSVGVARSGRRFGIRVPAQHFQGVFSKVKPDGQFLAPGQRLTWHCGPWPFGSDRRTLAKIFTTWPWQARPLQPARTVEGGVMWLVQSVTEPPQSVWNMQHGQVMVSRCDSVSAGLTQAPNVIGPQSTVDLCSSGQMDPWLLKDPWTQAVRAVPVAQPPNVSTQLQEIEERVEQSILQRLPAERMETDENDARISALEQQMQQLATRQQSLEGVVTEQHKQHTAQVQGLQTQVVTQMEAQRTQMEHLFESQMTRLESILAKKGRFE